MDIVGFLAGNLGIMLFMTVFAVGWNEVQRWRGRGRAGAPVYAYSPSRSEWGAYYWRRIRGYALSYLIVLLVLSFLPGLFTKNSSPGMQFLVFLQIVPGLLGYFVLAGLRPARFTLYSEGFAVSALIPFLPGFRDYRARIFSDFRVGLRRWRDYHDAVPKGEILLIRGDKYSAELLIPRGQRDRLLDLARAGLKQAKDERRRRRKAEHSSS